MSDIRKHTVCAHRGLSGLVPENTLAAFAAAQAVGADELEFDVRLCGDGNMIVSHDAVVDRVSDKKGRLSSYRLPILLKTNAGAYMNWYTFYCTPQQVIEQFGGRITLNIHINEPGKDGEVIRSLRRLLYQNNAMDYAYFSASGRTLELCRSLAPDIPRCAIDTVDDSGLSVIDCAVKYACSRVQFYKPHFDQVMIDRAHSYGISVSAYWADDSYEARRFLDMKIDTILTHRADILVAMPETN